jgi:hypothetical protein
MRQVELRGGFVCLGDAEWVDAETVTAAQWGQALAVTERSPQWLHADSQRRIALKALSIAAAQGLTSVATMATP